MWRVSVVEGKGARCLRWKGKGLSAVEGKGAGVLGEYLRRAHTVCYFYGVFHGNGLAFTPSQNAPKESKPLGRRPMLTSLCLALYGASQGEFTYDGPLGATTTLVWGLLARLSIFPTLLQIA